MKRLVTQASSARMQTFFWYSFFLKLIQLSILTKSLEMSTCLRRELTNGPSNFRSPQYLEVSKIALKNLEIWVPNRDIWEILKKEETKRLRRYTRGVFNDTSDRGMPGLPNTLGQWEKCFISKTENKKTAQMSLKWHTFFSQLQAS